MALHAHPGPRPQRHPPGPGRRGARRAPLCLGLLCLGVLCFASLLSPTPTAHAQSPRGLRVAYTSPDGQPRQGLADGAPLYAASHAVVIGIDAYQNLPKLRAAVADARAVAEELRRRGMSVRLLLDQQATRRGLVQVLGDQLRHVVGREDRVLIYFAGHGVSVGEEPNEMGYLMPVEGERDNPVATGVAMSELQNWLAGYASKHVLFVADACYSGLALSTRAVASSRAVADYLRQITSTPVRLALVAGTSREEANEWQGQGVFTRFFLEGIRGAADANADGAVTSDELAAYVKPEVAVLARAQFGVSQTPQLGRRGLGEFVFLNPRIIAARRQAARPAPSPPPLPAGPAPPDLSGYTAALQQAERARAQQETKQRRLEAQAREEALRQRREAEERAQAYSAGCEQAWGLLSTLVARRELPVGDRQGRVRAYLERDCSAHAPRQEAARGLLAALQREVEHRPAPSRVPEGFVRIEPGRFRMGSPRDEPSRESDEGQHEVVITRPFLLQATEVTQGQWKRLMGTNPSHFSACGDACPVENVNWWEALAYCNAASRAERLQECYELVGCDGKKPGEDMECTEARFVGLGCAGYRLPTEAEWEYAARAGTAFSTGSCLSTEQANYHGNYPQQGCPKGTYREKPVAVGSFAANAWGLRDMHGNVWEWCWDWYGDYPSGRVSDPLGPQTGSNRVGRGGSWDLSARHCRAANRDWFSPGNRNNNLGFRLLRSIAGP